MQGLLIAIILPWNEKKEKPKSKWRLRLRPDRRKKVIGQIEVLQGTKGADFSVYIRYIRKYTRAHRFFFRKKIFFAVAPAIGCRLFKFGISENIPNPV